MLFRSGESDPVTGKALPLPPLMEFHEDSFDLPEDAKLLVEGSHCKNQCFKVGKNSYGFQFHLEIDSTVVSNWIQHFRNGDIENYNKYLDHFDDAYFDRMLSQIPTLVADSEKYCHRIAKNWLNLIC